MHMFFDEKLSHDHEIKKKIQVQHLISWDKFDKICGLIFLKMFPFGIIWVNKISHKNDQGILC